MLEKEGHKVTTAKDSSECFEAIKREKPDLILMDVMMPNDNGWETCKKIKEDEKTQDILVAMFTVRTSGDSIEKSYKYAKADSHINKPFDRKELLETVKNILEKAGKS